MTRRISSRSLAALAAAGLLTSPALADSGPFTIERKLEEGARKKVAEQRSSQLNIKWKGGNHAASGAEVSGLKQKYLQEVRKKQPEILVRDYDHSTRTKHKPKAPPNPERTSLHGRRVLVVGLGLRPDGPFKVSKRDQESLRFDRLAEAMVPPQRVVAKGESWKISSKALASAMFANYIAAANRRCSAKVTLRKVAKVKGVQIATLKVRIRIKLDATESFPEINMNLKGEVKWALKEGSMAEARLEGPVNYAHRNTQAGKQGTWSAKGTFRWTYKAEFLAPRAKRNKLSRKQGAPPPPGTQRLVCSLNPKHRVEIKHYPCCLLCGKKLDKDFKCPKDHPWVWQYCPHDGAPLEPEVR